MASGDRCYSIISNPVYDADGDIIGAVIIIIDITEISKREQLRREFTSNVSHELKTPLTSISGFAEIMRSGGTDEATVIDFSNSIYDEAQRLITLVSDIIKISELDEGTISYEKEEVEKIISNLQRIDGQNNSQIFEGAYRADTLLCLKNNKNLIKVLEYNFQ
mgnify:CR=1 FL=1